MNRHREKISLDLAKFVRGDVLEDFLHRAAYSTDASIYSIVPKCIVIPRDREDVAAVIQYATEQKIPVVARGAGSGVAGESLTSGIVLDMTRYMNHILSVADDAATVTCQPGVVLKELNDFLAKFGRKIGPDPSSGNRAVIGGCVANNATGAHSLQYGYMADYIDSIECVLADGSIVNFKNDIAIDDIDEPKVAEIARKCHKLLSDKEKIINKALPKTQRNRSGYTIAGICHDGRIDLAKLLVGSEGTLAVFTKITLRTVPVPQHKALLQLEFDSLGKMAKVVPIIVESGAAACELMDRKLIQMALEAYPQYGDILPAEAEMVLMIEHTGQTEELVRQKIKKTDSLIGTKASGRSIVFGSRQQERLWKSRKDAVPLLTRKKGAKYPVPFIEDVSVENTKLAEYICGLRDIDKKYEIEMSFYGHTGDGELHVRPYLDLSEPEDLQKMKAVADEVFSLAWSMGGSISGEHADGLVRAAFVKRQYGEEFYKLLCKIKKIFDPEELMNPGKIINDDPDVMVKNLRAQYRILPEKIKTELFFENDELRDELEQCTGCGVCLSKETSLRMCPVYRALGDELGSSRAKANILRFWATGQLDKKDFESDEFRQFLSLCVNCKACSLQCPSGIDISRLVTAARAEYAKRRGLKLTELMLSHNRYLSIMSSLCSPISNFAMSLPITKWFLEKSVGFDKRRDMPDFKRGSFLKAGRKYLSNCQAIEKPVDKVAYFVDTYANYNDHELGFAVLKVLRHNNIDVILPEQRPAPLPAIVYGDVKIAKRDLAFNVKHLAKAVRDGYKIICSEPSAALCLQQELRHFVSGKDAQLVSQNTFEQMSYLLDLFKQGKLQPILNPVTSDFAYHCPCHLFAIGGQNSSIELFRKLFKVSVADLDAGCCGLAGTFGMQKKNYDLSEKISRRLKETLESSSEQYILTECAACGMQIEHISKKKVIHPIEILAKAYGLT